MKFLFPLMMLVTLFVVCLADDIHNLTLLESKCGGMEKTFTLLDISKECIQRAKHLYPNCADDELNCGKKEKSLAYLDVAVNVLSDVKKSISTMPFSRDQSQCSVSECPQHVVRPVDCSDVLRSGKNESGVYTIWPRIFANKSLDVYCDMLTDGGGWTVIQRRGNFTNRKDFFYKDWDSYKRGFGNIKDDFWIGNDNIFAISNQAFLNKPYTIRFDLKDAEGKKGYAEYNNFWIEDEAASYTLHIEGYTGNVGDSMSVHNTMKFSTKDRDNDGLSSRNCAVAYQGAWWYNNCYHSNLNGLYQPGIEGTRHYENKGATWYHWKNKYMGLSGVEIKLRS